jgi:molybdopterin synthase sulfur carrier subunit
MLKIKFFGVLRKFGDERGYYETSTRENMSVDALKTQLKSELSQKFSKFDTALIDESALASESEVLTLQSLIPTQGEIALLPPVCGG